MKVELEKTFPVPGSAEIAWAFLQDIEAVAGCMPGANITERLPSGGYKGTVSVKAGPATMSFRGEVEVRDIDPSNHSLRLIGKGTDNTGSSGASMDLAARIDAVDATRCNLVGKSEVSMSGKAAAFGGRMMNSIADQVLKQFADNFAGQVAARAAQPSAVAAQATIATVPPSAAAPQESYVATQIAEDPVAPQAAPPGDEPGLGLRPVTPIPPPVARELDGLALLWAVLKDWLRDLFGKKPA